MAGNGVHGHELSTMQIALGLGAGQEIKVDNILPEEQNLRREPSPKIPVHSNSGSPQPSLNKPAASGQRQNLGPTTKTIPEVKPAMAPTVEPAASGQTQKPLAHTTQTISEPSEPSNTNEGNAAKPVTTQKAATSEPAASDKEKATKPVIEQKSTITCVDGKLLLNVTSSVEKETVVRNINPKNPEEYLLTIFCGNKLLKITGTYKGNFINSVKRGGIIYGDHQLEKMKEVLGITDKVPKVEIMVTCDSVYSQPQLNSGESVPSTNTSTPKTEQASSSARKPSVQEETSTPGEPVSFGFGR